MTTEQEGNSVGRQFEELPLWEFTVVEVERASYRVEARRDGGIRGEAIDVDPERALVGLRDWAAGIERQLAARSRTELIACPVCGACELTVPPYAIWPPPDGPSLQPTYENSLGAPSYEVCPNCGSEFGNDDKPGTALPVSFDEYRADWETRGAPRFRPEQR